MNPSSNIADRRPVPSLSDPEAALETIKHAVLGMWDVVNTLTALRPPKLKHYHATIFGSARCQPGTSEYDNVRRLAAALAEMGCHIVTGGGPGLMQAANEGAMTVNPDNPQGSIGIAINLPFEEAVNSFVGQVYEHKTFFTRLHHFVFLSDAFVVMPGGIGTALETMIVWQLLQVRKLYGTPLILVGKMWSDLVAWARASMVEREPQFADSLDMSIPRCVEGIEEAIALIREHHAAWRGAAPERE
jgi:hypothetical protein